MHEGTPIIIKKVKKHGDHGHHGGAWKVAYADFVTAMMAFFMVLWILGMNDDQKSLIQSYFEDPLGFLNSSAKSVELGGIGSPRLKRPKTNGVSGAENAAVAAETAEFLNLKDAIEQAMNEGGNALTEVASHMTIELTGEGLQINLFEEGGVVFFVSGSAAIRPEARPALVEISRMLSKAGFWAIIDGHTDGRHYSGVGYDNMQLSADRARSVHRVFREAGMPEDQVLAVRGWGDKRLYRRDDPFHFQNRRVTVLLPFSQVVEEVRGLTKRDLPPGTVARYDPKKLSTPAIRPAPVELKPQIHEDPPEPAPSRSAH